MEAILVKDPRVDIRADVEKNHVVYSGGLRVNQQVNVADSWGTPGQQPTSALWSITPPSTSTILDRNVKIRTYFQIVVNQDLQIGLNDALRQCPIHTLADVVSVQINGENISDNVGDKVHAMLKYGNNSQDRIGQSSTSPMMPDNYKRYQDWQVYGSGKNPLASYGENSSEDPRGGFPIEVIDARTFRVVLTENVMLSPFLNPFERQDEGFVNINQLNISYRWKSNLSQILSHSALGNNITSVAVSMYQAPEILTTYITPDLTSQLPALQTLPYYSSQDFVRQIGSLTNGQTTRVVSDTLRLSQVPKRIYLFCRHQRSTSTQNTSDSFLRITNLSVLFNNQNSLFSSATEQDLFELSKRNGLNLSWSQVSKYVGSVICIEMAKDIGLLDSETVGSMGQYNIQVQCDVTNDSGETANWEFYQSVVYQGTFSISPNFGRATLGGLTPQAVLDTKMHGRQVSYHEVHNLHGSGFWSGVKSFFNRLASGVGSVARFAAPIVSAVAPEFAPLVSGIGAVANTVKGATGGRLTGAGRLRRRKM